MGKGALFERARLMAQEVKALVLALRDPRTPWYARAVGGLVLVYALSPIDLIPDFIPVLGYLDDLILVPLGVALTVRLIPAYLMAECRERARNAPPPAEGSVAVVLAIWAVILAATVLLVVRLLR